MILSHVGRGACLRCVIFLLGGQLGKERGACLQVASLFAVFLSAPARGDFGADGSRRCRVILNVAGVGVGCMIDGRILCFQWRGYD